MQVSVIGTAEVETSASKDTVWQAMLDFGNLSWSEGIAEVEVVGTGVGMVRRVLMEEADEWLDEELYEIDEANHRFDYGIREGFMGVPEYTASGKVSSADQGSVVRWQCGGKVDSDQAEAMKELLDLVAAEIARLFTAQFS